VLQVIFYLAGLLLLSISLISFVVVYQEWKIWSGPEVPSLSALGMLKIYFFGFSWMALCAIACTLLLVLNVDGVERISQERFERGISVFLTLVILGPVRTVGIENLPSDEACVYIANHSSLADVAVIYTPLSGFKWIVKKSAAYMPGVGYFMVLGKHVLIERKSASKSKHESIKQMYALVQKSLEKGFSIAIFPEGTRNITRQLPFKDGAFNMAMNAGVKLVPISINIPSCCWNSLYPLNLLWTSPEEFVVTIHKPVATGKDSDKEKLKEMCSEKIYSVLPKYRSKKMS